ncbi:MAG: phage head closure protein [Xanthobacteraceae bacterium]
MDRSIAIQRASTVIDDFGTPVEEWSDLVTLRAQIIQASTDEYIRGDGASDETIVIFRTWYFDGVTNADRIIYQGVVHNIKETKEIGRRQGLEIRTLSYGKAP